MFCQASGQCFRINDDLPLIIAKLRLEGFVQTDGLCRNHVHQWSALDSGKEHRVDLLREFLLTHNEAASWSAQTLMRGGGDEVCVRNRRGVLAAGYQACDMGHVDE